MITSLFENGLESVIDYKHKLFIKTKPFPLKENFLFDFMKTTFNETKNLQQLSTGFCTLAQ